MENVAQKNLVRRYLLGDLPEGEQLQLEQRYFADSDLFEQVWDWENELVDSYVRGQLTKQERDLFERNYLTTSKHQQRVAIARNLTQAADAAMAPTRESVTEASPSWWTNFLAFFSVPQMAWGGAAGLLLLTLGGWWYFRNAGEEQIARVTPQPSATASPIVTTPSPVPATSPVPQSTPQVSPTAQPAVPAILALALGGALRKSGDVQPLAIPRGTKQVRLQLPLEGESYASYQIKLRSIAGAAVLNRSASAANKKAVTVLVPANKLSPGDYVLTLSGVTSSNETEELQQHLLRVTIK